MTAFTDRRIQADGFEIRYAEAGDGPVLVCLHGAGGLRISPGHELLAERHRVIALEAPGFGNSAPNERSQTMAELAATIRAAIDALGVEQFNLWGTSFGGRLALYLAVGLGERERERLQSLAGLPGRDPGRPAGPATLERLYVHPERRPTDEPPPRRSTPSRLRSSTG